MYTLTVRDSDWRPETDPLYASARDCGVDVFAARSHAELVQMTLEHHRQRALAQHRAELARAAWRRRRKRDEAPDG